MFFTGFLAIRAVPAAVTVPKAPIALPVAIQASQRPLISPELRAIQLYLRAVFAEPPQVCLKLLLVQSDLLA